MHYFVQIYSSMHSQMHTSTFKYVQMHVLIMCCCVHLHGLFLGDAHDAVQHSSALPEHACVVVISLSLASPSLITHTRKSLYLCMYVRMYVYMYVAIRRSRVRHAVCPCAYNNLVKIVNIASMLTLFVHVAHQSWSQCQNRTAF